MLFYVYGRAVVSPVSDSLTHSPRFLLNGLANANQILGEQVFKPEDWKAIGEYVYDEEGGRHQAFYSPVKEVVVFGETVQAYERVQVEQSLKYSQAEAKHLWNTAGLKEIDQWMLGQEYGEYTVHTFPIIHHDPRFLLLFPAQPQQHCCAESYDTPHTFATGKPRDHSTPSSWVPLPVILV